MPKLVYLSIVGKYVTSNMLEFYTDDKTGSMNYSILPSVMYTDESACESRFLSTSKSGKYIALVNPTTGRTKILSVKNPANALQFVHPLGSLISIFELDCLDLVWHHEHD